MSNRRRQRFIAYFNGPLKGSRDKLMERTGLTKGRVSQLFDDKQAFGERAARNLAESLGLPPDFFEHDPGPDVVHLEGESATYLEAKSYGTSFAPPQIAHFLAELQAFATHLTHKDQATRDAVASALQNIARTPEEAPHIASLIRRILALPESAEAPATPAVEADQQRGDEQWDGINRRTRDEPVKTERRRPPLGLYDPESKPKRPKPGPKVIGGNW
jgi:hypothetical protein